MQVPNQTPTISIITVARNAGDTIRGCVESVKSQSYPCEHIIVDGCSSDDTLRLVRKYALQNALIISEPDKGAYDAMNKGLALATGDVIGILHADDFYAHKDVLAKIATCLADPDVDACYGDLVYVDRNDISKVTRYWKSCPFESDLYYKGWMIPHPTLYVRRNMYGRYGGFNLDLRSAADYELELRFFLKHRLRSKYIPEILVVMRAGSWSNSSLINRIRASYFDRMAWKINALKPRPLTTILKPIRKLSQFFLRPAALEKPMSRDALGQNDPTVPIRRRCSLNILVLNHYAGSPKHGMVFRHFYLGKEWVRQGHKVVVIGASFSHVRSRQPEVRGSVTEESIDGVRFLWLKTPRDSGNNLGRVLNMAAFIVQLFVRQSRLTRGFRPDVVIASSTYPLDIFPARIIAGKYKAKLIFDVRDLWPLTPIVVGDMSRKHPFVVILQRAEDFAYRKSQRVTSVLPNAKSYMVSRGLQPEKFIYIPNGVDPDEWEGDKCDLPEEHERVLANLRAQGRFLVGYTGAHGLAADLDTMLDAASLLRNEPVSLVLVGQGPEKERLEVRGWAEMGSNVIFLQPVSKACVPSLLRSMDALYIGLKRHPLFKFGVSPNKLLDYMMAAKPVIHGIEAGNDLVAESGCGISIAPESPQELAEAVRRLMRMDQSERDRLGALGHKYVLAMHDYKVLAQRFLEELG